MKPKTVETVVRNLEQNFSKMKARLKVDLENEKITKTQYLSWIRRENQCLRHAILSAYHQYAEMVVMSNSNLETKEEIPEVTIGSYNKMSNSQNVFC